MDKKDEQHYVKENVKLAGQVRKLKREVKRLEAEIAIYRAEDSFHNSVREALRKVKR